MLGPAALLALSLSLSAPSGPAPSKQSLVFYNARLALREEHPSEVLQLWLLHNSLLDQGEPAAQSADFRSLVWAALGELGLCSDGLREDSRGAGLWPLALHNRMVRVLSSGEPPGQPAPYDAFELARQQRFVSLHDVLSAEELGSVSFFPTACSRPQALLLAWGESPWADLKDRLEEGRFLRHLLATALTTLDRDKVQGLSAVKARIFDLDLTLAQLEASRAHRDGLEARERALSSGLTRGGAKAVREKAEAWATHTREADFLRETFRWPVSDWMALSQAQRLFLFARARPFAPDPQASRALALSLLDALLARGAGGEELTAWIGNVEAGSGAAVRAEVTGGQRGVQLLGLEPAGGFRERAVIALHRGVAFLEVGDLKESLRSFAFALGHADESREATAVHALSRRWLSFVLSRFETNAEVIATLQALVPRQDFNAILQVLAWRAALRADLASFERVAQGTRRGSAFDAELDRLRLLAQGRAGRLLTALRDQAPKTPYATLRFLKTLVEKLEAEEPSVRRSNLPVLQGVSSVLRSIADGKRGGTSNVRTAQALRARTQAILDADELLDTSVAGKAEALAPGRETYTGSLRLAPADSLPWPFPVPQAPQPSVFAPLQLRPVEWRDAEGALVFGWRISDEAR
jgi:hypothetical protein